MENAKLYFHGPCLISGVAIPPTQEDGYILSSLFQAYYVKLGPACMLSALTRFYTDANR